MSRTRLPAAVGLSAGASASAVALMGTSAWLLSRAAEHPPVLYLMVAIVAVRALGLARGVLRYAERLVGHDVALRRQAALRVDVYRALVDQPIVGRRGGDLLSRVINDVGAVTDLVVRAVVPLVAGGVVVLGTVLVLTVVHPAAGAVILLGSVLGAVAVPQWTARVSRSSTSRLAPLRGTLAVALTEATSAAPDLVAYGAAGPLLRRVQAADADLRAAEQRIALVQGVSAAAQWLTTGLAVVGALVVGSRAVAAGILPVVQLAVLVLTPLALHEVIAGLPAARQALTRARTALSRVDEVVHAAPSLASGPGTLPDPSTTAPRSTLSGLTLSGLTAGWPGAAPAVTGLDLRVAPGERVALVGPSGVGKTTVAATILGLLAPVAGRVEVEQPVGYLAQDAYLFDTTVAENVRLGDRDATDADLAYALHRVGLELELDRLVGEHGTRVSGGEARRIALARLLLQDRPVLVVDEPTEHLDRPTANALVDDLFALAEHAALVVITHDPELMARCDRVVRLCPPGRSQPQPGPTQPGNWRQIGREGAGQTLICRQFSAPRRRTG